MGEERHAVGAGVFPARCGLRAGRSTVIGGCGQQLRRMSLWNRYKYYSHKWVRWHTALWLVLAAVCVVLFAFSGYGPVAGVTS